MKWFWRKLFYWRRYVLIGGFDRPDTVASALSFLFHHSAVLSASDDGTVAKIEVIHRGDTYWSTFRTNIDLEINNEDLLWACQKMYDTLYGTCVHQMCSDECPDCRH